MSDSEVYDEDVDAFPRGLYRALREYRENGWKFDYLRQRVDTMGDGKKSVGTLSQLPRDVLYKIFSSH